MSRKKQLTEEQLRALKAAEDAQAEIDRRDGEWLKAWLIWATTNNNTTGKPAPVYDLAEYRKKKQARQTW